MMMDDDLTILEKFAELFVEDMNMLAENFMTALSEMMDAISEQLQVFVDAVEQIDWMRWEGENLIQWGERLQRHGLMDDPEVRGEYQRAVWSAVVSPVGWMWRWLR